MRLSVITGRDSWSRVGAALGLDWLPVSGAAAATRESVDALRELATAAGIELA